VLNQQTIAAIGFPVIIMLLVPVRYFIVPYLGIKAAYLSNGECGTKADELDDQKDQDSRPPNLVQRVCGFDTTRERL
jgi:hypothetical protein